MPPKPAPSADSSQNQPPTKAQLTAINNYLAQKSDFDHLIAEARSSPSTDTARIQNDYERLVGDAVRVTSEEKGQRITNAVDMPSHPKEEEAEGDLTDLTAKASEDSSASWHPLHKHQEKAIREHHQANPGPVISQNLPEPASKEELRARAEELNKKN